MEQLAYLTRFTTPTLIEVWTPTCPTCRAMEPDLIETANEFAGHVDLVQINASKDLDITRELGVRGSTTLIGVNGGAEVFRTTGGRNAEKLRSLFSRAAETASPQRVPMSQADRLRTLAGTLTAIVGLVTGPTWVLVAVGLAILAASVPGWVAHLGSGPSSTRG